MGAYGLVTGFSSSFWATGAGAYGLLDGISLGAYGFDCDTSLGAYGFDGGSLFLSVRLTEILFSYLGGSLLDGLYPESIFF